MLIWLVTDEGGDEQGGTAFDSGESGGVERVWGELLELELERLQ